MIGARCFFANTIALKRQRAPPMARRQRTLCYLGELNGSAHARWQKTVEVFNEQGESSLRTQFIKPRG